VDAVDPDIDLHVPAQRAELAAAPWTVLGAIAAGGAIGAVARYGLTLAWPHPQGAFPWSTFVINVSGCLLIGCLMVPVERVWRARRLVRPFLGVGVLGGFTTFSGYVLDTQGLLTAGAAGRALAYLGGTAVAAVLAAWAGQFLAGRVLG
jgi:fluoride exporter